VQGAFGADYKRRRGLVFSVFGVAPVFVHTAKLLLLFPYSRELFLPVHAGGHLAKGK
jgi:hypothetical protein